jgi:hypothetical protein
MTRVTSIMTTLTLHQTRCADTVYKAWRACRFNISIPGKGPGGRVNENFALVELIRPTVAEGKFRT